MDKIELSILGISYNQTKSGAYALILSEVGGKRRVPIIIGGAEAQAIAIHLEGLNPPRPLTHDLFVSLSDAFNIKVKEILIYKMENGVFFSEILFDDEKTRIRIDSRTSDAVALAIRSNAPVFISSVVMEDVGLELDMDDEIIAADLEHDTQSLDDFSLENLSDNELKQTLEAAILDENYELAGNLKEELDKRSKA